jgi:hypothetical protein
MRCPGGLRLRNNCDCDRRDAAVFEGRAKSPRPSPSLALSRAGPAVRFPKHFEVIGSDTGTRYRIRHGQMINIDQLDFTGKALRRAEAMRHLLSLV